MSVSLVTSALSLLLLGVLVHLSSLSPAQANVVASVAAIGPCFALNRRIAWRCTGRGHLSRELLPFWCYGLAALVATTAAVHLAGHWADSIGVAGPSRTLAVLLANVVTSIGLWFGRFALLERTLTQQPAEA
jgi:putative flippase GtrA